MIVFINGSFGSGKTSVAEKLNSELENSIIFDPEEVGYMLRNIIKSGTLESYNDFQDISIWPDLVVDVIKRIYSCYDANLIVPMTLSNRKYFNTIFEGVKKIEPDTLHFCLTASIRTLKDRIIARDGTEKGHWALARIPGCVESFKNDLYSNKIDTEQYSIDEITNQIKHIITQQMFTADVTRRPMGSGQHS